MSDQPEKNPKGTSRKSGIEVLEKVLGYSRVWFTHHALQRMKEREISQSEVIHILRKPTRKNLKTQVGRERWRRHRSERLAIDVVFERWPDQLCIVTVIDLVIENPE